MSNKCTTQIEKDIAYCIDECDMNDEQIGQMLRATEELGNISVEYFCEEFIFVDENQEVQDRWHDDDYLRINWSLN